MKYPKPQKGNPYSLTIMQHVFPVRSLNLGSQDVLNPHGCTIDGRFTDIEGYFDIKGLGFQAYVAENFRDALNQKLPGYIVTINGAMDVAVKDIENHAFGQLSSLATKLSNGGTEYIPQLNWHVRAQPPQTITSSTTTINPYRLSERNRYYPFKTAGQFTRNAPFILVFSYAAQFNQSFFLNLWNSTDVVLRSLARRVFIQLTRDRTPAIQFDDQVAKGFSVADAALLISALLFINLDEGDASIFLNPRATHKIDRNRLDHLFDFKLPSELLIDDFEHDNY